MSNSSFAIWFTGLSGAGKSTLAEALEVRLKDMGLSPYILDGDVLRTGLNSDLGFSDTDRVENLRRAGEVGAVLVDAGVVTLAAFITPFVEEREHIRAKFPEGRFLDIWCAAPLEVCEGRDVKGLYARARRGEIPDFTGIDSPFEADDTADMVIPTHEWSVDESIDRIITLLKDKGLLS